MRTFAALLVAVLMGLLAAELAMEPTMETRLQLTSFFVVSAVSVAVGTWWFPRWARRVSRLQRTVFVLGVAAVLAAGVAVTAASGLMFISSHDLRLLWIVLGFALSLGVVFAATVARPLTEDLQQIADTAERVGHGDLGARTGVTRPDEVGSVADALDIATARLAEVEEARGREHEARQAFLTAIGHDLRTPLSALRAAVEALQDGVASDLDRYLRAMHADVEVLTSLVDDLFLLARIEAGHLDLELTTVDLSELADEAIEAIRPVADRSGVTVHLETEGRVRALGGAGALSRVIRNLIDNAIQHSPPNGTVAVRVEGDGGALVRVTDSGPGFDADLVDRAFESFTRGDRARTRSTGGAGLGLAIARGFVEAHGGTIWADPGPGGQVAFRIPAPTGRPAS